MGNKSGTSGDVVDLRYVTRCTGMQMTGCHEIPGSILKSENTLTHLKQLLEWFKKSYSALNTCWPFVSVFGAKHL